MERHADGASVQSLPVTPRVTLWNVADALKGDVQLPGAETVVDWIVTYIVKPSAALGRHGPVCPFVAPSLRLRCLWVAVVQDGAVDADAVQAMVRALVDAYHAISVPSDEARRLLAFVLALPTLARSDAALVIDGVHAAIKPEIVAKGLMLGEFYPGNESPGARNPHFHAAESPVPLFVLRRMVSNDIVFLNKHADPPALRARFLRDYLRTVATELSHEQLCDTRRALEAALVDVQRMDLTSPL